ncbi:MAG: XisI protein [Anaerolineae bacterium]
MDRLAEYRCLIQRLLSEFAEWANGTPGEDSEMICLFDEKRDYYMVLRAHWGQYRCVQGAQIFIRIRNGKIWIEEDWTEEGIATDLLKAGVSKEEIVLGFQPPEMRRYTEFAVA